MYPFTEGSFAVRNAWYVAAFSHEIGRAPLERWFLDEPVVMYRREDGVAVAMAGICPHRHMPLGAGYLEGDTLVCRYHGIGYGADGKCNRIPTQGRPSPAFNLKTFPLAERWKWLWIWMGDPALADEALIPDHDAIDLGRPEHLSVPVCHHLVNGRTQLLHDNLFDLSHIAFLHSAKFGTEDVATTPEQVTVGPNWVRSVRDMKKVPLHPDDKAFHGDIRVDFYLDFTFHAPCLHAGINIMILSSDSPPSKTGLHPGDVLADAIVFHALTPATKNQVHYFFALTSRFDNQFDPEMKNASKLSREIIDEDIFATEEIERILQKNEHRQDLLTKGDVALVKGRALLQAMMDREKQGAAS